MISDLIKFPEIFYTHTWLAITCVLTLNFKLFYFSIELTLVIPPNKVFSSVLCFKILKIAGFSFLGYI